MLLFRLLSLLPFSDSSVIVLLQSLILDPQPPQRLLLPSQLLPHPLEVPLRSLPVGCSISRHGDLVDRWMLVSSLTSQVVSLCLYSQLFSLIVAGRIISATNKLSSRFVNLSFIPLLRTILLVANILCPRNSLSQPLFMASLLHPLLVFCSLLFCKEG